MANVNRFNQAILLDNGFFLHCFSLYQPLFLIYHESNKLYSIKKPHADIQIPKKWRENKNFPALTYIRMYNRLYIYYPNWSWICMISIWIARIFHDRWPKKNIHIQRGQTNWNWLNEDYRNMDDIPGNMIFMERIKNNKLCYYKYVIELMPLRLLMYYKNWVSTKWS